MVHWNRCSEWPESSRPIQSINSTRVSWGHATFCPFHSLSHLPLVTGIEKKATLINKTRTMASRSIKCSNQRHHLHSQSIHPAMWWSNPNQHHHSKSKFTRWICLYERPTWDFSKWQFLGYPRNCPMWYTWNEVESISVNKRVNLPLGDYMEWIIERRKLFLHVSVCSCIIKWINSKVQRRMSTHVKFYRSGSTERLFFHWTQRERID